MLKFGTIVHSTYTYVTPDIFDVLWQPIWAVMLAVWFFKKKWFCTSYQWLLLKNKNVFDFFSLFVYSLFNKGCLVAIDCTCTPTFLNILLNNPRSLFKGGKPGKVMFTKITRVDEFQRTRFGQSSHLLLKIVCAQLCSLLYSQFLKIIFARYGSSFMKNFK